jgi:chemotaxis protein methyltransferase CheR
VSRCWFSIPELRVRVASRSFHLRFQVSRAETEGHLLHELGNGQWRIPGW